MKAFQKDENCKLLRVGFCVFFGFVFLCVNLCSFVAKIICVHPCPSVAIKPFVIWRLCGKNNESEIEGNYN
jgi:hypothetical protein